MTNQVLTTACVPINKNSIRFFIAILILVSHAGLAIAKPAKTASVEHTLNAESEEVPSLERFLPPPKKVTQQVIQETEETRLAWDQWKHTVNDNIYQKIRTRCIKAHVSQFPALRTSTSFRVTRNGHLLNTELLDPSSNAEFNTIVIESINSMNETALLEFPDQSTRLFIDMTGTFYWQYTPHPICRVDSGETLQEQPQPTKQTKKLIGK